MQRDIKAISRCVLEEAWNKGNLAPIDQFVSPDYVFHDPNQPEVRGPEGARQMSCLTQPTDVLVKALLALGVSPSEVGSVVARAA